MIMKTAVKLDFNLELDLIMGNAKSNEFDNRTVSCPDRFLIPSVPSCIFVK